MSKSRASLRVVPVRRPQPCLWFRRSSARASSRLRGIAVPLHLDAGKRLCDLAQLLFGQLDRGAEVLLQSVRLGGARSRSACGERVRSWRRSRARGWGVTRTPLAGRAAAGLSSRLDPDDLHGPVRDCSRTGSSARSSRSRRNETIPSSSCRTSRPCTAASFRTSRRWPRPGAPLAVPPSMTYHPHHRRSTPYVAARHRLGAATRPESGKAGLNRVHRGQVLQSRLRNTGTSGIPARTPDNKNKKAGSEQ